MKNRRILLLLNRLIFNPAFKTACVRRPVQNHAKVIVKTYTRIEVFLKKFREVLTGDPNALFGGLGPPIPPSTRVKT